MDLSWLCAFYFDEDHENCNLQHHAKNWCIHFIALSNLAHIQIVAERVNDEDEKEHKGNGDEIVQSLEIGVFFHIKL